MYVNYFDRHVKTEVENHTIGIVLCKKKIQLWLRLLSPKTPTFTPVNTSSTCPAKRNCNRSSRNGWESRKNRKPIAFRASPWQGIAYYRAGTYLSCSSRMAMLFPTGNKSLDMGKAKY
jgi:hypothetical protein